MDKDEQCKIHSEMLVRMDERVREMHKWTFGNGQPGAAGRLVELEVAVKELRKPKTWPAVVAAICAIVAVVINFYVAAGH